MHQPKPFFAPSTYPVNPAGFAKSAKFALATIITYAAFAVLAVATLFTATGCSTSNLNIAAKSLITAQEVYDATMHACAEAHAQGLINDDAKLEIIVIGNLAHDSIALAQAALIAFVDASTVENESKLAAAIIAVKDNIGRLVDAALKFGVTLTDTITNYTGENSHE